MNPNLKELVELVNFLFDLPDTYKKAQADGKFDFSDLQYVLPLFNSAKAGIEGIGNPLQRWRELSEEEKALVMQTVKARFDIADDVLEVLIERWFEEGVRLAELVGDTIAYATQPKEEDPA